MDDPNPTADFDASFISDWFWTIIDAVQHDREKLRLFLKNMTRDEIVRFYNEFQEAAVQLVDEPFTDYIPDISEDGMQDVAEWVVSQGKTFFSEVWGNPERILTAFEEEISPSLGGVAEKVFWERFQELIPDDTE